MTHSDQLPEFRDPEEAFHEKGRFDVYKGVYADLKSTSEPGAEFDSERNEREYFGIEIKRFLDGLGDEVMAKSFLVNHGFTNQLEGSNDQRFRFGEETEDNPDERVRENRMDYRRMISENKYYPYQEVHEIGDFGHPPDFHNMHLDERRLSPFAKMSIYELYLEGTQIKDICYRFGIVPSRAKAVIWCHQRCLGRSHRT